MQDKNNALRRAPEKPPSFLKKRRVQILLREEKPKVVLIVLSARSKQCYSARVRTVGVISLSYLGGIMSTGPAISPAFQPVHDHPGDPARPSPGIALCLSGGGYRAMLFHLGTLWRLNELQYLPRLDRISSVSGGSITSGVLAMNWKNLQFNAEGCAENFDQLVTQPVSRMASTSIDISSVVTGIFGGASHEVA